VKYKTLIPAIGLGLAAAGGAHAAPDPVDILIQRLVQRNVISKDDGDSIRAEIAAIAKENKAVEDKKKTAISVTAKTPIKVSGYTQVRYQGATQDGVNDSFDVRRVRLSLTGDATPVLDYGVLVDFAGSKKGLTDSTHSGAFGKPILVDGLLNYKFSPALKLTAGQFKVPFGYENLASDALLDTVNRAAVTETLVPGRDNGSLGRDIGVQVSGASAANPRSGQVEYQLGVYNGSGINVSDDNESKDLAGRLVWKPAVRGLSLGAAQYLGRKGTPHAKRDRTGLEAIYNRDPYSLKAEYVWAKDASLKRQGYYVTGAYKTSPVTQAVVRFDRLDPNTSVANDAASTWTAGLNYFLSKDTLNRVQVNYERHREQGSQIANDLFLAQFQAGF
jgi:phosphate-selective porin